MKFNPFKILMVALVALSGLALTNIAATAWQIDKTHSAINFSVRHFFTPVTGSFSDYEAVIHFDPENLEESNIDVTINVNSIDTKNARRDGHLQSEDFFGAEKWPTISFKSSEIQSTGENTFIAKGKLTIKDVTKDFELPFNLLGMGDHPMREGAKIAGITASATIDRSAFGVGTGDWASDAVVGDEVSVELLLELNSLN